MKSDIGMLKMKANILGCIWLVMALISVGTIICPLSAKAGFIHPQQVLFPSSPPAYAEDITTPLILNLPSGLNYWGLFFDDQDTAVAPESYTVGSSITYEELAIDGYNSALYGIQNKFSNMLLEVSKGIQIKAVGADTPTKSGFVNITGIDSVGSVTTSSDASVNVVGNGSGALDGADINVSDVRASATGIQTTGDGAVLTVHGDVTIEAHGGCTQAAATGATNAQATGILHKGASGEIENTGTLNVIARGGTMTNSNANVDMSGITSTNSGVRITNRGNINVEGWGGTSTSSVSYASVGVTAYGIEGKGEVFNYGDISVYAKSGTGMKSYLNVTGISGADIENHGNITVESEGGKSSNSSSDNMIYGLYSKGDLDNHGKISVTSKGGTYLKSGVTVPSTTVATGILSGKGSFENTGDISVRVEGASCNAGSKVPGKYTFGIGLDTSASTITNTGTIDVQVVGGAYDTDNGGVPASTYVYGMLIRQDATLNSSGLIRATAAMNPSITAPLAPEDQDVHAYQVRTVANLRITGYAMEIGHEQDTFTRMYQGTIYSSGGKTVTFDNTTLTVHLADDYKDGLYDIPRLWGQETAEQKAASINQFASLAPPPDVTVKLYSGDESTPQRIGLNYAPEVSTPLKQALISMELEKHIHSIIHDDLTGRMLFNILPGTNPQQSTTPEGHGVADSSSTMVASLSNPNILPVMTAKQADRHSVFVRPVFVNSSDSASTGYNSNTYGFVLGYNYKVNEQRNDCYVGVHAGYTRGDIRYTGEGYGDRKEFVDTFYGGVHGITRLNNNVLLSGEASFFYADDDMTDNNPANRETASYNSVAIRAEAELGYLWTVNGHNIIPAVGLEYSWQHRDPFTTNNTDSADTTYGTMDNHELYGNARLKWTKPFVVAKSWRITPLIGVGITQVLTDGELSNSMQLGNETQLVVDQDENTTFTPEANITVAKDNYYAIAGYSGGFGGTTKNNLFWLQLGVGF